MTYVQLRGGFPGGVPPPLVVPVLQSPIRIRLVNYFRVHLHHEPQQMHTEGLNACIAVLAGHRRVYHRHAA